MALTIALVPNMQVTRQLNYKLQSPVVTEPVDGHVVYFHVVAAVCGQFWPDICYNGFKSSCRALPPQLTRDARIPFMRLCAVPSPCVMLPVWCCLLYGNLCCSTHCVDLHRVMHVGPIIVSYCMCTPHKYSYRGHVRCFNQAPGYCAHLCLSLLQADVIL